MIEKTMLREAFIEQMRKNDTHALKTRNKGLLQAITILEEIPDIEVVGDSQFTEQMCMKANGYDQVKWERDIAVQQLKELGYSLGEKVNKFKVVGWIPCSERLPEINEYVLVTVCDGHGKPFVDFDYRYPESGFWWSYDYNHSSKITHWMPLPEPYREDGAK